MQRLRNIILLCFSFYCFSIFLNLEKVHAFINVESLRHDNTKGFNGAVDFSLAGAAGNVERNTLKLNTFNEFSDIKNELLLIGSYSYGQSKGARDLNRGHTHFRYTRLLRPILFIEFFNQLQFSEFQRLDLRVLNGVGLRLKLVRREDNSLSLFSGLGFFYETEDLKSLKSNDNFRLNSYISLVSKPLKDITLTFTTYAQPVIDDFSDFRLQSDFGFSDKITEKISIGITLRYVFDSRPPDEVKKEDLSYKVSLNFKY